MHNLALISSHAIRGLPPLLLEHCNDRALSRAFDQAGLSENILDGCDTFITQRSLLAFAQAVAGELGEPQFGLLLAPHLSLNSYGDWGNYILAGDTLEDALLRTCDVMKYYSAHDSVILRRDGEYIRYSHNFASTGAPGYDNVAMVTAAVMISTVGSFLGRGWKPSYIELDIHNPHNCDHIESVFGCPVHFGASAITIPVPVEALSFKQRNLKTSDLLTRADVVREARGVTPKKFPDTILEIIRTQLTCGRIGLEATAFDLQIGPRKFQRQLEKEGTSYRKLVTRARMKRAKELLSTKGLNIAQISGELGYSSPSQFSRAFNSAMGISPSRFKELGNAQHQRKIDLN